MRGTALETTGQQVADAMTLARDNAIARSRRTEVRFIKIPAQDGSETLQVIQPWIVKDDSGAMVPIDRPTRLPDNIAISETNALSPLLNSPNILVGKMKIFGVDHSYIAIAYRADGSLEGLNSGSNTFLTIVPAQVRMSGTEPSNFRSIYINPVTGKIYIFSP